MTKNIIVYYSRTGNTKKVAEIIGNAISCELIEIKPLNSYKGFFGWWRAGYQAVRLKIPPIEPIDVNFNEYERVIVGTPVWAGNMSSPIRAFLTKNQNKLKNVAFFNTSGGADNEQVLVKMSELVQIESKAMLDLSQKEVKENLMDKKIEKFVQKLI